jgi:hypothetical protein
MVGIVSARYYPDIFLVAVRKMISNITHGQRINQAPPKYNAGMLLWRSKACHLNLSDLHHMGKMHCIIKT